MKPTSPFPPFDPDEGQRAPASKRHHGLIPMRYLLPNMITVLAIVTGLSSIRFAYDGRFEAAIIMLLAAAALDGLDGRLARFMKGASRFGEQLDSLADAINFGVAPAIVCYSYILHEANQFGWMASVIYCVACCLRLARFNVSIGRQIPDWQKHYFVGIPAPAGSCVVLMPIYLGAISLPINETSGFFFSLYTLFIAFLMVSNLPSYNAKSLSIGVRRDIVIPACLLIVAYAVLLMSYPWQTLAISCLVYLGLLPLSSWSYRRASGLAGTEAEENHP